MSFAIRRGLLDLFTLPTPNFPSKMLVDKRVTISSTKMGPNWEETRSCPFQIPQNNVKLPPELLAPLLAFVPYLGGHEIASKSNVDLNRISLWLATRYLRSEHSNLVEKAMVVLFLSLVLISSEKAIVFSFFSK